MLRALITVALILGSGASPEQAKVKPAASKSPDRPFASDSQPFPDFDEQAERQLLEMANKSRSKAGAPPLAFDDGLIQAARAHAAAMAREQQLSHQLNGEPSLPHRLSAASVLHLDHARENVALDLTADHAHESLMLSPPHRENLLDTNYNVAGFGVVCLRGPPYVGGGLGARPAAETPEQTGNAIRGS